VCDKHASFHFADPDEIFQLIGKVVMAGGLLQIVAFGRGRAEHLRDRKEASISLQYLTHPMLDDRTGVTNDVSRLLGEFVWTRGSNQFGWSSYLSQPAGLAEVPYPAVPARIENLQGLAPCHIVCGALDLLVIENLAYAQLLVSQGVPTEVHIYPGALHGFMSARETDLAKNYFEERKQVFQSAFATVAG
jgi:acetyl esterase/lipase